MDDPLEAFFQELTSTPSSKDAASVNDVLVVVEEEEEAKTPLVERTAFAEGPAFLVKPLDAHKELEPVDHGAIAYRPFRKTFYKETPDVHGLSSEAVRELRFQLDQIRVRGAHCPKPVTSWAQCGLPLALVEGVRAMGFAEPTPIQAQALPAIMSGRDIIGIAKTGSGKTLAFILPMLRHVMDQPAPSTKPGPDGSVHDGPIALILTPTRELAMQTFAVVQHFCARCELSAVVAYGGVDIKEQIAALRRDSPAVVVATPGRWIDLLLASGGKVTNLRSVSFVVLDEADRLFDMGFGPQVIRIMENIRPDKQAVLFSATFPRPMEALARKILLRPVEIVAGHLRAVCSDVQQQVCIVDSVDDKFLQLLALLGTSPKTLVFVDRQVNVDVLVKELRRRGHASLPLHGGMEQIDRDASVADFRAGIIRTMVATSVASRGLDVADIDLVVNYDAPSHLEDYIHRAGRTGRAGRPGLCVTLLLRGGEGRAAADIVRALRASNLPVPDDLKALAEAANVSSSTSSSSSGYGGRGLQRLDKERASMLSTQRTLYVGDDKLEAGIDDSSIQTTGSLDNPQAGREAMAVITSVTSPRPPPPPPGLPANVLKAYRVARSAAEAVELAIANRRGTHTLSLMDPIAAINAKYKPLSQAIDGEIVPIYASNAVADEPKSYQCDIDVNDYPAHVRLKATQKDTLLGIISAAGGSGVSLIVRGQYVQPSSTSAQSYMMQERLHIRIDGTHLPAVEYARAEIRRLLMQSLRPY